MFPYRRHFGKRTRGASILVFVSVYCVSTFSSLAQMPADQGITDVSVIVLQAKTQVVRYSQEFRELLAKETKTFKIFDKRSELKKQRIVESNFLVYGVSETGSEITEFRNVLSVDAKPVNEADDRAVRLFEKVERAKTSAQEIDRIQKESLRFDPEIKMHGLTLFQAIALNPKVRDVMKFALSGTTKLGDSDVYVLKFDQTKESPFILAGDNNHGLQPVLDYEFDSNGSSDARISGTLWIDSKSFQIVREFRSLTVQPKGFLKPAILTTSQFEFSESKYGIRTPKRITHTEFRLDKDGSGSKFIEITFEYSQFTRPDVEVIPKTRTN